MVAFHKNDVVLDRLDGFCDADFLDLENAIHMPGSTTLDGDNTYLEMRRHTGPSSRYQCFDNVDFEEGENITADGNKGFIHLTGELSKKDAYYVQADHVTR